MASYHDLALLKQEHKTLWRKVKEAYAEADRIKAEHAAAMLNADVMYARLESLEAEIAETEADLRDSEEDSRSNS